MNTEQQPRRGIALLLDHVEETALIVLLGLIVVISFVDVIVRNIGAPLSHVQELLPNIFVWLVWIGVPYGIRGSEHFQVKLIPAQLRARIARPLRAIGSVIGVAFFALAAYFGAAVVALDIRYGNTTPLGFSAAFIDIAVPVGSVLAIVRLLQSALAERDAQPVADAPLGSEDAPL